MGTVYLALDRKHGRHVAVKVLPPDVASAVGPERFLREIRIAAQLSHPNILPLHDSGQAAGMLYYVMPHVDGESLRDRLARDRRLPIHEALEIGSQIADALDCAHRAGVIHRDVKPENILLDGPPLPGRSAARRCHALLADFGVAKALDVDGTDSVGTVNEFRTDTGGPIGTVAYASPEQAAGSRDLDGRSDIYSLGCVLYEMLVGEPPEGGPTASQILENRFAVPPPGVRSLRGEVPDWVDRAMARALARNRTERFLSAAEFREALSGSMAEAGTGDPPITAQRPRRRRLLWMSAGAAMLAMIGAAVAFLPRRAPTTDPKQVVVAGFENRTGDSTLASVGDIATDYIARGLAATRVLHEVYDARTAALESGKIFSPDPVAARGLARRIGAGTVIWGSYYRDGDSLHFESQLLDAASGRVILSLEPAIGPLGSPAKVVEVLRQRVMAAFGTVFGGGFEPWEAASIPPTYEAYREVMSGGEAAWQFNFEEAAQHYRRAAALDTSYVGAKTALAFALAEGGDCAGKDSIARQLEPIRDRLLPVDRGSLDYATAHCRGDLDGALDASRSVIDAAPETVGFRILASVMALELFRPRTALALLKPLESRRDQLTGTPGAMYGDFRRLAYHMLGDYQQELKLMGESSGIALAKLGRFAEVREVGERMLSGGDPQSAQCLALELRAHGFVNDGREMIDRVVIWHRSHPDVQPVSSDRIPCLWLQLSPFYDAGWMDESRSYYERLATEDTTSVTAQAGLGALAARRGDRLEATRIDRWLAQRTGGRSRATYARARMAALAGDRARAVALLQQAFDEGLNGRMYIHIDPDFESLRDDPGYRDLMKLKDEQ